MFACRRRVFAHYIIVLVRANKKTAAVAGAPDKTICFDFTLTLMRLRRPTIHRRTHGMSSGTHTHLHTHTHYLAHTHTKMCTTKQIRIDSHIRVFNVIVYEYIAHCPHPGQLRELGVVGHHLAHTTTHTHTHTYIHIHTCTLTNPRKRASAHPNKTRAFAYITKELGDEPTD